MSTITANTGSNNWNTNAAWSGGSQPTAGDDAVIPSGATVTIPSGTTAVCRSCTNQSGGAIAFAATTSNLNIGTSTAGTGNVAFSNSGTITLTAIGTINLISTSATQQTIKTNGSIMPNITFNGVGSSYLQSDAITATGAVITASAGTWATGGFNVAASQIQLGLAGSGTRTWSPGASTITLSAGSSALTISTGAGLTVSSNTSVVIFSPASALGTLWANNSMNWNGMSLVFNALSASSLRLWTTSGSTIANLVVFGAASKTFAVSIGAGITVTGTIAFQGNSVTNRLLVQSDTLGTARTITNTGASATASVTLAGTTYQTANVDLMDMAFSTAVDLSAIPGLSGDCGGNSGITFTTAASQTNTGATGNWSDATKWTSRVPLPQDNVIINTGSGTITADMPRLGANLNFTGFTGTASFSSTTNTAFGNWTNGSNMTFNMTQTLTLGGRGAQKITCAGVAFGAQNVIVAAFGGSYTFQDAFTKSGNATALQLNNGSLDANGFTVSIPQMTSSNSNTRSLTLGTGSWLIQSTSSGSIWNLGTTTNLSFSGVSATIVFAGATTNSRTFTGGGLTYGTLQYTVSGFPGPLVVTGANTFANITVTTAGNAPKTLTLPSSTTTTVTGTLTLTGTQVSGSVYLPGANGCYISTPDAAWNEITGDIDLRVQMAADSWSAPALNSSLVAKWSGSTNRAYIFYLLTTGKLQLSVSHGGTIATTQTFVSSVTTGFVAGTTNWVRVTWRASDGQVVFYTSADGATWVPLGTTGTLNIGSMFASTQALLLGSNNDGSAGEQLAGKIFKVQILNGIGGTMVASPDFTTTATGLETSYTDAQGNCMWEHDRIMLADGSMHRAADLVGKEFEMVGWNSKTAKTTKRKAWGSWNRVEPVYRLVTESGREIFRNGHHPIWTGEVQRRKQYKGSDGKWDRNGTVIGHPTWKGVADLKPLDDAVLVPVMVAPETIDRTPFEEAALMGYLLGDGSTIKEASFCQMPGEGMDEFIQCVENLGCVVKDYAPSGLARNVVVRGSGNLVPEFYFVGLRSNLTEKQNNLIKLIVDKGLSQSTASIILDMSPQSVSQILKRLMSRGVLIKKSDWASREHKILQLCRQWSYFGKKNTEKLWPAQVWTLHPDDLAIVIGRLFACDGNSHITNRINEGYISIGLSNESVIRDLQRLMLRLGIVGRVNPKKTYKDGIRKKDSWVWTCLPESVERFGQFIDVPNKREQVKAVVAAHVKKSNRTRDWNTRCAPDGYRWELVRTVERIPGVHRTVAIEVEKDHAWVDLVVEHNTWTVNGATNSNVYLNSSTATTTATLALSGAMVNVSQTKIQDDTVTGSTPYYDSIPAPATRAQVLISNTSGWAPNILNSISDSINGSDSNSRLLSQARSLSESINGVDGTRANLSLSARTGDNLGGNDSPSRLMSLGRAIGDAINGNDSNSRVIRFMRSITDSAGGMDNIVQTFFKLFRVDAYLPIVKTVLLNIDARLGGIARHFVDTFIRTTIHTAINVDAKLISSLGLPVVNNLILEERGITVIIEQENNIKLEQRGISIELISLGD